MSRERSIAARTASAVTSWNTTRRTGLPSSAPLSSSQLSTCQAMASALAVGVGGEHQRIGLAQRVGDRAKRGPRAAVGRVDQGEAARRIDRAVLRRQVLHVAAGGDDRVAGAEKAADGLRLGGRFDDDDVHGALPPDARRTRIASGRTRGTPPASAPARGFASPACCAGSTNVFENKKENARRARIHAARACTRGSRPRRPGAIAGAHRCALALRGRGYGLSKATVLATSVLAVGQDAASSAAHEGTTGNLSLANTGYDTHRFATLEGRQIRHLRPCRHRPLHRLRAGRRRHDGDRRRDGGGRCRRRHQPHPGRRGAALGVARDLPRDPRRRGPHALAALVGGGGPGAQRRRQRRDRADRALFP